MVNPLFEKRPKNFGIGNFNFNDTLSTLLHNHFNLISNSRSEHSAQTRFDPICQMAKIHSFATPKGDLDQET